MNTIKANLKVVLDERIKKVSPDAKLLVKYDKLDAPASVQLGGNSVVCKWTGDWINNLYGNSRVGFPEVIPGNLYMALKEIHDRDGSSDEYSLIPRFTISICILNLQITSDPKEIDHYIKTSQRGVV